MKIYIFAALSVAFAANGNGEVSVIRRIRALDDSESDAPSQAMPNDGMNTPQPTVSNVWGVDEPGSAPTDGMGGAPTDVGGFNAAPTDFPSLAAGQENWDQPGSAPTDDMGGAPTDVGGFDGAPTDFPSMASGLDEQSPSPDDGEGFPDSPVPAPTEDDWNSNEPAPTEDYTQAPWPTQEQSNYDPADDDPLQPINTELTDDVAWQWRDSSVEQVKHDRTVLIALTVTFAIGILLAILTAQQMLENPHGCCASICRIMVACTCAITGCLCYPCRMVCGCTNNDRGRRNHDIISDNADYTHDLELS